MRNSETNKGGIATKATFKAIRHGPEGNKENEEAERRIGWREEEGQNLKRAGPIIKFPGKTKIFCVSDIIWQHLVLFQCCQLELSLSYFVTDSQTAADFSVLFTSVDEVTYCPAICQNLLKLYSPEGKITAVISFHERFKDENFEMSHTVCDTSGVSKVSAYGVDNRGSILGWGTRGLSSGLSNWYER